MIRRMSPFFLPERQGTIFRRGIVAVDLAANRDLGLRLASRRRPTRIVRERTRAGGLRRPPVYPSGTTPVIEANGPCDLVSSRSEGYAKRIRPRDNFRDVSAHIWSVLIAGCASCPRKRTNRFSRKATWALRPLGENANAHPSKPLPHITDVLREGVGSDRRFRKSTCRTETCRAAFQDWHAVSA